MTERCKSNPCCGDYFNCKRPPQFLPREGYEAYQRRIGNAPREASMAENMPERILDAASIKELSTRLRDRAEVAFLEPTMTARCDAAHFIEAADAIEALFIRADLAVLASTHQRALDALREAKRVERQTFNDAAAINAENDALREALNDLLTRPTDPAARQRARAILNRGEG